MRWIKLEEFTTGNALYLHLSPSTPLVVMQGKEEHMSYVKIDNQLVTVKGSALDIISEIDQHLAKEEINV